MVIPREANLPIDAESRRVVAGVSQAVVAVVSVDGKFICGLHALFCVFLIFVLC